MAWIVLVLSGICEAVWAVALDKSQGFTKIIPVIVFFCGLAASMARSEERFSRNAETGS